MRAETGVVAMAARITRTETEKSRSRQRDATGMGVLRDQGGWGVSPPVGRRRDHPTLRSRDTRT
ncbi:hypothetical protein GCM10027270_19420 [Nocardioides ginkgobilobae]